LASGITDVATSATFSSGSTGYLGTSAFGNGIYILIDSELILVTAYVSGETYTISRGEGGTSGASHTATTAVNIVAVAELITELQTEVDLKLEGAGSSTDHALPRWNGTGGILLQDSGVILDDSDNMDIPGTLTINDDCTVTAADGTLLIVESTGAGSDAIFRFKNDGNTWQQQVRGGLGTVNHDAYDFRDSTGATTSLRLRTRTSGSDPAVIIDQDGTLIAVDGLEVTTNLEVTGTGDIDGDTRLKSAPSLIDINGTSRDPGLMMLADDDASSGFVQTMESDTAGRPSQIWIGKARASAAALQDGDAIGGYGFLAHDGTDWNTAAQFQAEIDGAVAANTVPTALVFKTTTTNSLTEAGRFTPAGDFVVVGSITQGGTAFGGLNYHIADAASTTMTISTQSTWTKFVGFNTTGGNAQTVDTNGHVTASTANSELTIGASGAGTYQALFDFSGGIAAGVNRQIKYGIAVDHATPDAITSSTDATPIVVTTTGNHDLLTGDSVIISGHGTNVAANGSHLVVVLSATTFELHDMDGGDVAGSGAGAGSGGNVDTHIHGNSISHRYLTSSNDLGGVPMAGEITLEASDTIYIVAMNHSGTDNLTFKKVGLRISRLAE
jgi:hypothetical protein